MSVPSLKLNYDDSNARKQSGGMICCNSGTVTISNEHKESALAHCGDQSEEPVAIEPPNIWESLCMWLCSCNREAERARRRETFQNIIVQLQVDPNLLEQRFQANLNPYAEGRRPLKIRELNRFQSIAKKIIAERRGANPAAAADNNESEIMAAPANTGTSNLPASGTLQRDGRKPTQWRPTKPQDAAAARPYPPRDPTTLAKHLETKRGQTQYVSMGNDRTLV